LKYRETIFVAKTKPTFSKVFSSLQKIRRSQDWVIQYPKKQFPRINPEETLFEYCENKYPFFTSITNWVFDVALRKFLIDPNAVGFIYPQNFGEGVEENGYVKPVCEIYGSHLVLDFVPEDYAVLKIAAGCKYMVKREMYTGTSFYFITTAQILRYDQIDAKGTHALTMEYNHDLNELPVIQLKGIVIDHCDRGFKYESRIAAMLPELDEAIREYSDLQAAKVLHIYPERWEYTQNECNGCKGSGRRINQDWTSDCNCPRDYECSSCHGTGYIAAGPYSKIMVRPVNNAVEGGGQIPTPPAGYVEKDSKIVELQEEGVKMHLYYALAAINYEFLSEAPLSTSGVSKEYDRDESNNWTHSLAEDVVAFMDSIYHFIGKYRYKSIYTFVQIADMMPAINVPEKYDLMSAATMQKELTDAKNGKFNPIINNALEDEYAGKRFATEPDIRKKLQLVFRLDPLPNISEDEKMSRLSNKGITIETYIISSNIHEFIERAIDENEKFADLLLKEQKAVLMTYANEIKTSDEIIIPDLVDGTI